jgi:3-dehydroquinate synthase
MSDSFDFSIQSSTGAYTVSIGEGTFAPLLIGNTSKLVVDQVLPRLFDIFSGREHIAVQAIESAKTLETVGHIIERLRDLGANRKTHLIAVGGGIVQDVVTFAASSYMRGIAWTYCPTTLLGMVDSSIGGKSSINVGPYKNIAGNFYPPKQVLIDTRFCTTLATSQLVEGFCEAAKICFADRDGVSFERYLALMADRPITQLQSSLAGIIALSLHIKKAFIEEDEFDQNIRLLLNFGHTFGHAIEGASNYQISHGVAVGLGMLVALDLSERLGMGNRRVDRIQALTHHIRFLLAHLPDLPAKVADISAADALIRLRSDKKHTHEAFAFILFDTNGFLIRHFLPKSKDNEALISSSFEMLQKEFA